MTFKPATKDIVNYFYTLKSAKDELYECKCGTSRKKVVVPIPTYSNTLKGLIQLILKIWKLISKI